MKQQPVVKTTDRLPVSECLDTQQNYGSELQKRSGLVLLDGYK